LFPRKLSKNLQLFILIFIFGIYIGLRDVVGGDWYQYLAHYNEIANSELINVLFSMDIGYVMLNYISALLDGGIYLVNYISAVIFLSGLFILIRDFRLNFSLSLFIAFPYLITIIALGYTRQSIAMGFLMIVLSLLQQQKKVPAFMFLILAILFHKTAVFGIIFFIERFSYVWIFLSLFLGTIFYVVFQSPIDIMYRVYFLNTMQSSGGFVRLLLLSLVSILFFKFRRQWSYYYHDYNIISKIAVVSILFFLLLVVTGASTLFDRLSLYLYPLQIIVLSRVLYFIKNKYLKIIYIMSIIILYSLMLIVFMLYGGHNYAWVPYDNLLFRLFE
jgi:hypothetical protein